MGRKMGMQAGVGYHGALEDDCVKLSSDLWMVLAMLGMSTTDRDKLY